MASDKVKQYKGQSHVPSVSPEDIASRASEDEANEGKEDVVGIDVWFVMRGHQRNPVLQAAMRAICPVRKATPSEFDTIFKDF